MVRGMIIIICRNRTCLEEAHALRYSSVGNLSYAGPEVISLQPKFLSLSQSEERGFAFPS